MKLLIILGSPRKNGNSELLAQRVAEGFSDKGGEVEYIRLNTLKMRPCQGCGGCEGKGVCVLKDDLSGLYHTVDTADRLLLTSPVYFYGLSAQCKIFGDRMQAKWVRRYELKQRFRHEEGRKGYLLSTAATRGERIFEPSVLTTRYIFDALDVEYGGDLLIKGVDSKKEVLKLPETLDKAVQFGRDIYDGVG